MPIDRIKCIGITLPDGELAVFEAGKLKYRAIEAKWETQLLDGEHVEGPLWIHLEFDLLLLYLSQQLLLTNIPAPIKAEELESLPELTTTVVTLKALLDSLRAANTTAINFYPRLMDQTNTVNATNYRILGNRKELDLMIAESAGRFPMYTPISLKTKSPLTTYPSWINR